jgi:hypothetical protein
MPHGLLHLCNAQDILKLGLGTDCILVTASAETAKDVAGFLFTADFDEPARRFREEPDNAEEYN